MTTPTEPNGTPNTDDIYPFYELRFIMRVLSRGSSAPQQDLATALGMARDIFSKWHGDRLKCIAAQAVQQAPSPAVVTSEPIVDRPSITRLEIIEPGVDRKYMTKTNGIRLSFQDEGRTLKVFIESQPPAVAGDPHGY
jgi:hypothetical protein